MYCMSKKAQIGRNITSLGYKIFPSDTCFVLNEHVKVNFSTGKEKIQTRTMSLTVNAFNQQKTAKARLMGM